MFTVFVLSDDIYLDAVCRLSHILSEACNTPVVKSWSNVAEGLGGCICVGLAHTSDQQLLMCACGWAPLNICICACVCALHLDTHKKDCKRDSLTGVIIIAGLKRGFGRTWDELAGSESCVLDGDDN